jgi:hypothetical protein
MNISASVGLGVVLLLLPACEESQIAPRSPGATAVEDRFWQFERAEEAMRPPLLRPRSISLGLAGDAPLANGVMR